MAQTRYKRPYNFWLWLALFLALSVSWFLILSIFGWTWHFWLTIILCTIVGMIEWLTNPGGVRYKTYLADGTIVRVKRPLIGFKKLETQFGLTGGYEVSGDGWRYEKGLWVVQLFPLEVVWCDEPIEWPRRGQYTASVDEDLW